ncbi:hypothetical protein BMF77_pb00023 (plasmid) [Dolichospermum sp. UHCC 0315A]|uniref:hypothetical protein n=1 Tax=Dolichospermum sp. UHCC 0315A TaxID=1914871 RepID=UPI00125438B2|nr:hypothetical protein BMF77_04906 [Dolichospermum sp. UHCC 0315A]QEI44421.1 hypothetical protein BMF77_pb00023 [Dolichospermum sp. UHCC 0315A]
MLDVLSVLEKLDVPFGKWTQNIEEIREAKSLASIVRGAWKLGLGVGKEIVAHIPHPKMLQREITEMKIKGSIKTNR